MNDAVLQLLDSLRPDTKRLVAALRQVVRRTVPHAKETCLWGGLSYHRPAVGGRVKGAVCMIGFKRDQVRLDFIHGVRLADPAHLLRNTLKSKRYVPINSIADTERPELAALIRNAAAIEWGEPGAATGRTNG